MPPFRQPKSSPSKSVQHGNDTKGSFSVGYFPKSCTPIRKVSRNKQEPETKSDKNIVITTQEKRRHGAAGRKLPLKITSPAIQSISDSYLQVKDFKSRPNGVQGCCPASVQAKAGGNKDRRLKKAGNAVSETTKISKIPWGKVAKGGTSRINSLARSESSTECIGKYSAVPAEKCKFKTASSRLLSNYPQNFSPEIRNDEPDSNNLSGDLQSGSEYVSVVDLNTEHSRFVGKSSLPHWNSCDKRSSSDVIEVKRILEFESYPGMLAADVKQPMSLMEQKKLQWAREREELNGLWSPWGRPHSKTGLPTYNPARCSNKLLTSTLQSECLLPPISNHITLGSREQQKNSSSSPHWTCDSSEGKDGMKNGNRKSNLPICINATTGEVHYNHNSLSKKLHQADSFQVNNSIVISGNNLNSAHSTASSIIHGKGIEGKKITYYTQQQQQQSSAHSLNTININGSGIGGGWSSFDEETFTSGYQSESNGFLSNGEDYGYHSRNGSGDKDLSRKGHGGVNRPKKQNLNNSLKTQLSPCSSSGQGDSSNTESKSNASSFENPSGNNVARALNSSGGVLIHSINADSSTQSSLEESRESFVSRNNQLNEMQSGRSSNNLSSVFNNGAQEKQQKAQPPPPAMRSSIPVGVDPAIDPESLRQLQKMEREKWLHELEKQREEQRIRKQMEKDEKRPKWGDKGIGVGHFWEPSTSEDHLPPSAREDTAVMNTPAWLEKGLSRMQNSVSQPSLNQAGLEPKSDFPGISAASLFSNQSSVDLRNVIGLNEAEPPPRAVLRGQNAPSDPDASVERERKRQAALEHQEAIRKQIEERQSRLREEKERRLQEELADEEKIKMQRLRELERLELEARKLGRCYNSGEENDDASCEIPDLTEITDVRRILKSSGRTSAADISRAESRRMSLEDQSLPEELQGSRYGSHSNMTSSQSMMEIPRRNSSRSHRGSVHDISIQHGKLAVADSNEPADIIQRDRPISAQRSRSLSHHREFGTQTDHENSVTPALSHDGKSSSRHHRSHNCLAKGGNKSKSSTGEESEGKKTMKLEKPRWGATPSKKQYQKQSEKDPLYQQRLKRRMDRIKKFEERLNNMGIGDDGNGGGHGSSRDSGPGHSGGTETESENSNNERRGRSPSNRFRSRHNQSERSSRRDGSYDMRSETVEQGKISRSSRSPRRQNGSLGPAKSTGRISINHNHHDGQRKTSPLKVDPRRDFPTKDGGSKTRIKKVFPEIPGRTIGPLKPTLNGDFDQTFLHGSSENSSRFSSPSLESISSHKNTTSHYYSQRVVGRGDEREGRTLEVDLESHYVSSTSRSIEVHYEDGRGSTTEVVLIPPSTTKKTVIESNDEMTYRKTIIEQNSVTSQSAPSPPDPETVKANIAESHQQKIKSYQNRSTSKSNGGKSQSTTRVSMETPKPPVADPSDPATPTPPPGREPVAHVGETYEEFRQLTPSFSFEDNHPSIPPNIPMAEFDEIPVGIPSSKINEILSQKSLKSASKISKTNSNSTSKSHQQTKQSSKTSVVQPQFTPTPVGSVVPTPMTSGRISPNQIPSTPMTQTRLNSPPVPAVLKKLQAGIPIEDLAVCDDLLYEIPRVNTAGSTSNGYKSVESDSSNSHRLAHMSRFSSSGVLELDGDPGNPSAFPQEDTNRQDDTLEGSQDQETTFDDDKDEGGGKLIVEDDDDKDGDGDDERRKRETKAVNVSSDSLGHREEDDEEDEEEEEIRGDRDRSKNHPRSKSTLDYIDTPWKPLSSIYDERELYDAEPIYPYPIPKISPRLPSPYLSRKSIPTSPVHPRISGETTTLEVLADYRSFHLPDYDYDNVKAMPQLGAEGLKVSASVHRPRTQDTDLSKREKLISYVLSNKDLQAQISARDSELSEKGIIEFNVRLPSNIDGDYEQNDYQVEGRSRLDGYEEYDQYRDPLLSERQRATLRWLYSSESSSSNPRDSILTHLSYLKKGIQKQQQEWNVVPSDTDDTGGDDDSIVLLNDQKRRRTRQREYNDISSEDSKYS